MIELRRWRRPPGHRGRRRRRHVARLVAPPRVERAGLPAAGHPGPRALRLLGGGRRRDQRLRRRLRRRDRFRYRRSSQRRGHGAVHRGGGDTDVAARVVRVRRRHVGAGPRRRRLARRRLRAPRPHLDRCLRMVPVALALTGSTLDRATVAFIGWFGPSSLGPRSVFGLIAVDALEPAQSKVVLRGGDADRRAQRAVARRQRIAPRCALRGVLRRAPRAPPARARAIEPARHGAPCAGSARRAPGATRPLHQTRVERAGAVIAARRHSALT